MSQNDDWIEDGSGWLNDMASEFKSNRPPTVCIIVHKDHEQEDLAAFLEKCRGVSTQGARGPIAPQRIKPEDEIFVLNDPEGAG